MKERLSRLSGVKCHLLCLILIYLLSDLKDIQQTAYTIYRVTTFMQARSVSRYARNTIKLQRLKVEYLYIHVRACIWAPILLYALLYSLRQQQTNQMGKYCYRRESFLSFLLDLAICNSVRSDIRMTCLWTSVPLAFTTFPVAFSLDLKQKAGPERLCKINKRGS